MGCIAHLDSGGGDCLIAGDCQREPWTLVSAKAMQHGRAIYAQTCSLCHDSHGTEAAIAPNLAGDSILLSRNPTTVLRIILQGAQSYAGPGSPATFSMPAFASLNDQSVADVATYIRNMRGNRAPAASVERVRRLRAKLLRPPR
jgi:mono/diheme cytochrome c family protein